MNKKLFPLYGVLFFFFAFVLWSVGINNSLVRKDEDVKASWAQVENVYQRRIDLIPNLVNTVKGYAKHEKETLENVIRARSAATAAPSPAAGLDPKKIQDFQKAQEGLTSALSRLLIVVEKYPELKADRNFLELQSQLEGTENRISVERRRFNEVSRDYNSYLRTFPQSIIASFRGFTAKPYFEAQAGAQNAPKVEF